MLENVAAVIVQALKNAGINAVSAYDGKALCEDEAVVSVSLDAVHIASSGLGSYIGICSENGDIKEMYGDKAEIRVKAEVYCPPVSDGDCTAIACGVIEQLRLTDDLSVLSFEIGQTTYDEQTCMLRCACMAQCRAYLVRSKLDRGLTAYGLGETE